MGSETRFFDLNTGAKIPAVGLGTWQSDPGLVGAAVASAVKIGYRHIDCAQFYRNEKEIGLVLKKLFEDGVVKRHELFITSKLWSTDHLPEDVPLALERTLQDLQLDYVDLYLIHWPVRMKKGSVGFKPENLAPTDIPSTWKAMESIFDSGKARAIGVSNFSTKKLADLLEVARIPPAVNQVECHPSWQQQKLHDFCKSKGIHLSQSNGCNAVYENGDPRKGSVKISRSKETILRSPNSLFSKITESAILNPVGSETRFFDLNTGAKIPAVGLGTWQSDPGLVGAAVASAVKIGYRHIDCAQFYRNEKEIGLVLKKLFEDGVVKRHELFITSKLWSTDHLPEDVPLALERTLQDLQLDYVDLYLIHWPVRMKKGSVGFKPENLAPTDIPSTWKAMESVCDSGKARAIGVSNFSTNKLADLLEVARIPPAVNQVECHPSWQQQKLHDFCKSKGIHLSGYSPLGSPGTSWLKSDVLRHPVVTSVAEKLGKTPAQVALWWGLQMGHSVLPKSTSEERIKLNFEVFGWSIPDDLFAKFSEIEQERVIRGSRVHWFVQNRRGVMGW